MVVQHRGDADAVRTPFDDDVSNMPCGARAAGGDDGHVKRSRDFARELDVITFAGALAVDRGQQDLTGAETHGVVRPLDDVFAGFFSTAVGKALVAARWEPARLDRED